jgi:hypothetical protein
MSAYWYFAILDAILSGKRDPVELAQLCHSRVKSPRDKVAQALVGDYRPEHLFTLKQSLEGYRYYQKLILELDQETARLMQALPSATEHPMPPRTKATAYHRKGNDPRDRHRCQPVPQRLCLRLMAWSLPGKTSQRRQNAVL